MAHRIPSHPATPVRRAVLTDWPQGLGVASISRRSSAVARAWPVRRVRTCRSWTLFAPRHWPSAVCRPRS